MKKALLTVAVIMLSLFTYACESKQGEPQEISKGQQVYQTSCIACHLSGTAGAPRLGDKDAWASRVANGQEALLQSVINGKGAMPPRGVCSQCSDEDLKLAIEYMIEQSQ